MESLETILASSVTLSSCAFRHPQSFRALACSDRPSAVCSYHLPDCYGSLQSSHQARLALFNLACSFEMRFGNLDLLFDLLASALWSVVSAESTTTKSLPLLMTDQPSSDLSSEEIPTLSISLPTTGPELDCDVCAVDGILFVVAIHWLLIVVPWVAA
ncbi:hypothetical protein KCV07_g369, partial [Aureobasidium melanogenum]